MPAELGGADAPPEMLDDDPELESEVLGRTTGSRRSRRPRMGSTSTPATTRTRPAQGGPDPERAEPDLKDAGLASTDDDRYRHAERGNAGIPGG